MKNITPSPWPYGFWWRGFSFVDIRIMFCCQLIQQISTLEAGMTFMQDMFLHRGNQGFRWEDGLLVKANGPAEMLSSYGRRINILDR